MLHRQIACKLLILGSPKSISDTLLGYSSIAHAGYVLVAVTTHSTTGTAAAMFYLAAYALMNYGAFAIVTHVAGKGEGLVPLAGLYKLSAECWLSLVNRMT